MLGVTNRNRSMTWGEHMGDTETLAAPSAWAVRRFGANATQVLRRVPQALGATVNRALDAHTGAKMTTDHAFGNARWPLQYEELANHLRDLPDTITVRAPHTFFELVIVSDHLLLPWYYADHRCSVDDSRAVRPLTALTMELLTRFGPEPRWRQPHLPLHELQADGPDPDAVTRIGTELDRLDPPPGVVIVGYACNSTEGLLDVQWGEAALGDDRLLHWHHREALPIPPPRIPHPRDREGPTGEPTLPLS